MQPQYTLNEQSHQVTPVRRADNITLDIDGHPVTVQLHWLDRHHAELMINGKTRQVYAAQDDKRLFIHLDGQTWHLEAQDEFSTGSGGGAGSGRLSAPMPGVVIEVSVAVDDEVNAGDTLMLIESMKLQTEIKAPHDGRVSAVGFEAGASFDKGALLVDITANETAEEE